MQVNALTAGTIERLACPVCRGKLKPAPGAVRCTGCRRTYPIEDGIPVLIESRAMVA